MKHEYKIVYKSDLEFIREKNTYPYFIGLETGLNKLSENGWELVAVYGESFIFKK